MIFSILYYNVKKLSGSSSICPSINPSAKKSIQLITTAKPVGQLNINAMKRKVVGLVLLASLIISVSSGCIVREDSGNHRRHWHRDHNRDDYRYRRDYDR